MRECNKNEALLVNHGYRSENQLYQNHNINLILQFIYPILISFTHYCQFVFDNYLSVTEFYHGCSLGK